MYLRLAWRNIWRNRRRTLITAASVFMAVILSVVTRSLQLGTYQRMIDNVVRFYSGHIQIHQRGYNDEQTIDNSFEPNDTLKNIIAKNRFISSWAPRLESFALASAADLTKGTLVVGVDPAPENDLTRLKAKIISGGYFDRNDKSVLVAEGLAAYLHLGVNDTLVLYGQGYHGAMAAGKYPVKGILRFPSPELNNGIVYMPLPLAQELYGTGDRYTSIVMLTKENVEASTVAAQLRSATGKMNFEVIGWEEMMPEMVQAIQADNSGGVIAIAVLYLIISFGIFGTVLMMLAERMHEFGILVSIGMKKLKLAFVVLLEVIMITGLGVVMGTIGGIPIIAWFHSHPLRMSGDMSAYMQRFGIEPVFPFSADPSIFFSQALIVFSISALIGIYPLVRLSRLNVINALKN
ncbi:MAG TPA: FtsX-like permease family protein [Bacteroidia bacterium]|nr:FtsX-like permease family protein [Bacteroidia bacterium]